MSGAGASAITTVFQVGSGEVVAQDLVRGSGARASLAESLRGVAGVDRHAATRCRAPGRAGARRRPTCRVPIRGRRCRGTASVRGSPTGIRCRRRGAPGPACPSRAGSSRRRPGTASRAGCRRRRRTPRPVMIATSLNMSSPCSPRIAPRLLSVMFTWSHGPSDGSPASTERALAVELADRARVRRELPSSR